MQRLAPEDARILALESGAIVGHTCKVIVAERRGDTVELLRERIRRRIGLAPSCRRRIAPTPWGIAPPAWVDEAGFDVRNHVQRLPGPVDRSGLLGVVAERMAERLPRDRPLWAIDVVDVEDDLVAAIWRIHHAMADGQATMQIGSALLWSDSPDDGEDPAPPPPAEPYPSQAELLASALSDRTQDLGEAAYRLGHAALARGRWRETLDELRRAPETIRRELRPAHGASPLDAHVGRRRLVSFLGHPLETVHNAAHAVGEGVTINDLLLGAVAGGLRRWLEARHGAIGPLRVQVPVSMHKEGEAPGAVPNRDSFINVELPVQEEDPVRRVLSVSEQTRTRKAGHDAEELYALFADVGHASKALFRLAHRLASSPHVFALSISNVRGPAGDFYLVGGRILEVYSLAEIAPHHALRVSANSFGGRMAIGLNADADAIPDLHVLAEGVDRSLAELTDVVPA